LLATATAAAAAAAVFRGQQCILTDNGGGS